MSRRLGELVIFGAAIVMLLIVFITCDTNETGNSHEVDIVLNDTVITVNGKEIQIQ